MTFSTRVRRASLASLVAILVPTMDSRADTLLPAPALLDAGRPLVIAHRGYSAVAPENTLPAFQLALGAGADLVELDYHSSKDGQLIVIHDATLDRTTDATNRWGGRERRVDQHTLAELKGLNAGGWFHPPYPGIQLPTLPEALTQIQRGGVTLIERKAGDAGSCVQLLREMNLINRVVVQAFDWDYLRAFRRLDTNQVLGALGPPGSRDGRKLADPEKQLSVAWLDEIRALGAQVAVWNRQVDAPAVAAAHARGLKVWIYTINDQATAAALLDAGVDGIISDQPAMIWRTIALRNRTGPPSSP